MNPLFVASVAVLAFSSVADATIILGTTAAATAGTATTLSAASVASLGLLGGVAILKAALFAVAISSRGRGRRSAEESDDALFAVLASAEPAQCYRRLICDLAAEAIPDNDKLVGLFQNEVSPVSYKFEYVTAAKVGKMVKNSALCELRYSCPLSTEDIAKLLA